MKKTIIDKYYTDDDKMFHVVRRNGDSVYGETSEVKFKKFSAFYRNINGDLENANLYQYPFNDADYSQYDLKKAILSSESMIKLGIYDDSFYKSIVNDKSLTKIQHSQSSDIVPQRSLVDITQVSNDSNLVLSYISDLHINHKLINHFKNYANQYEVSEYFRTLIKKMKQTIPNGDNLLNIIIIVGDVSFNFEMFKLFFKIYREEIKSLTFFVLGNHDLWDKQIIKRTQSLDQMIDEFRTYFNSLEKPIILLENNMWLKNSSNNLLSEDDILNMSCEQLRKEFQYNHFAIIGGMGFAGLNNSFNSNNGIYRAAHINRQEEIERSKRMQAIHEKLKQLQVIEKCFLLLICQNQIGQMMIMSRIGFIYLVILIKTIIVIPIRKKYMRITK